MSFANSYLDYDPNSGITAQQHLYNMLMNQRNAGTDQYYSSQLDHETQTQYMADLLAKSGITNLNQVATREVEGTPYERWEMGGGGADADPRSLGMFTPMQQEIYNKVTGKQLDGQYDRTQGNTWGGTFAGQGNTGFDVTFDSEGMPIFSSHGASSNQNEMTMLKVALSGLAMAGGAALAPMLGAGEGAAVAGAGDALFPELTAAGWGAADTGAALGAGAASDPLGTFISGLSSGGAEATGGGLTDAFGSALATGGGTTAATTAATTASGGLMETLTKALGGSSGNLIKGLIPLLTGAGAGTAGTKPGSGSDLNSLIQALLANKGSQESADYALTHAEELRKLGLSAIDKSSPWDASGGRATADAQLQAIINGNLDNDAGAQYAQRQAARATSKNIGGMSTQAAANAAMKFQNERIQALSSPAGVQFDPGSGYKTAVAAEIAANTLGGEGLASKAFGNRTQNTAIGNTASSFVDWLLKNGGNVASAASGAAGSAGTYTGPGSINWDGSGATSYDDALFGDFGFGT